MAGSGPLVSFTTANQLQAGIWAPAGESVRDGSLYVATGNGMPPDQVDDSDSVLRLGPDLAVQDRFTPANFVALSSDDQDLGSTAPALLPGGLVFQIGKQGTGYVLDGNRLGGTGGELASADLCEGGFGGDAVDGSTVVFSCYTSLRAIEVTPAAADPRPVVGDRLRRGTADHRRRRGLGRQPGRCALRLPPLRRHVGVLRRDRARS